MKEQILSQPPRWHLAVQLLVELSKLLQETIVWGDVPVGADTFDGVRQRHVLMDHQVGQDQGGRSAETHRTVDEHLTCRLARNKNHSVTSCGSVKKNSAFLSASSISVFTTMQWRDYCGELYSDV